MRAWVLAAMDERRRALVTGGIGHSGSHLVNLLVGEGWHVTATDLPPAERRRLLTKERVYLANPRGIAIDTSDVTFVPADLTDRASLDQLFQEPAKYDVIFHTASLYDYFAPLEALMRVNVGGLRNLLQVYVDWCKRAGLSPGDYPRFIHWSTCGVYGQPCYDPWDEPATEDAPLDPPNDYSRSKAVQECLLEKWHEREHVPCTIIRPAPIYGPHQLYGMYHVYHLYMNQLAIPVVHIQPRHKRLRMPMVHVEDLSRAALFLAQAPLDKVVNQKFNVIDDCGYQDEFSEILATILGKPWGNIKVHWPVYELVGKALAKLTRALAEHARKQGKRPKVDAPMSDYVTHQYFFSNKKIKDLGFRFHYPDMYRGTKQTIAWYKEAGWLEPEPLGPLSLFQRAPRRTGGSRELMEVIRKI